MEKNKKHKSRIDNYLKGAISGEEASQLIKDLENKNILKEFDELSSNWEPKLGTDQWVDERWGALKEKLARKDRLEQQFKQPKIVLRQIISYAAVIVITFLLGGGAMWLLQKDSEHMGHATIFEIPRGQRSKVTLSDGTEVWLNASTRLEIKELSTERRVAKINGEAFFKVHPDKNSPFTVETKGYNIRVLGTSFNVLAYDDFDRIETTLVEGSVELLLDKRTALLKPNQSAVMQNNRLRIERCKSENHIAWVESKLVFESTPFKELIKRLEMWYDVDIECNLEEFKDITFAGTLKNEETIWQLLDAAKYSLPIEYEKKGFRKIKIMKRKE
ncbi:FecR family protein [Puteibacter caeruleilacunae]|nr:FecR family protein [Puteibacter caeruleilacunae]